MSMKFSTPMIFNGFVVLALLGAPLSASTNDPSAQNANASTQQTLAKGDIESINMQLDDLYKQLKSYRKKAFNNELEAQRYFRSNPHQYLDKVQAEGDDESQVRNIKNQIKVLIEKKEAILKQSAVKPTE